MRFLPAWVRCARVRREEHSEPCAACRGYGGGCNRRRGPAFAFVVAVMSAGVGAGVGVGVNKKVKIHVKANGGVCIQEQIDEIYGAGTIDR